jgi:hypothetical protein
MFILQLDCPRVSLLWLVHVVHYCMIYISSHLIDYRWFCAVQITFNQTYDEAFFSCSHGDLFSQCNLIPWLQLTNVTFNVWFSNFVKITIPPWSQMRYQLGNAAVPKRWKLINEKKKLVSSIWIIKQSQSISSMVYLNRVVLVTLGIISMLWTKLLSFK